MRNQEEDLFQPVLESKGSPDFKYRKHQSARRANDNDLGNDRKEELKSQPLSIAEQVAAENGRLKDMLN